MENVSTWTFSKKENKLETNSILDPGCKEFVGLFLWIYVKMDSICYVGVILFSINLKKREPVDKIQLTRHNLISPEVGMLTITIIIIIIIINFLV